MADKKDSKKVSVSKEDKKYNPWTDSKQAKQWQKLANDLGLNTNPAKVSEAFNQRMAETSGFGKPVPMGESKQAKQWGELFSSFGADGTSPTGQLGAGYQSFIPNYAANSAAAWNDGKPKMNNVSGLTGGKSTQGMSWDDYVNSGVIKGKNTTGSTPTGPGTEDAPVEEDPYAGLLGQIRARMASDPAAIQAIYKNLADQIAADEARIAGAYDMTGKDYTNTANQTTAGTNSAYQSVRDASTDQLNALGIQEAITTAPDRMSMEQQQSGNAIQQLLAANLASNTLGKQSALAGNIRTSQAALGQGANNASAYLRNMANQLTQTQAEATRYGIDRKDKQAQYDLEASIAAEKQAGNTPSMTLDQVKAQYAADLKDMIAEGISRTEAIKQLGSLGDYAALYGY